MASVIELYKYLDKSIPSSLSCDWDNDGLMCCPDPDREVKKVFFTLDITEKAASYAIENGYDLIISHHPLIFRPISNVAFDKSVSRTVMMLVKAGISAFSFHTRLDSLNGGVNDALAERLEIVDPEELDESGAGRIGYLSDSMTAAEFANFVKKRLGVDSVRYTDSKRNVNKVAIVGGSGKEFIDLAIKKGADTFVSGEIGYSAFSSNYSNNINLVEAGHFFTENPVLDKLILMVKGYCDVEIGKFFSNEVLCV